MVRGQDELDEEETFYDRVGGHPTFRALIGRFFTEVRRDAALAALYPPDDWEGAEARLLLFIEQYWGGPMTYSRTRGAPMLKMRHMPYKITARMRDHWVGCMRRAVASIELSDADAALMHDYIDRAASYLINADE